MANAARVRAQVIVDKLVQVGIEVEVVLREWPKLYLHLKRRQCAFYLLGWICVTGDAADLLEACIHSPDDGRYGRSNWNGYLISEVDQLVGPAARSLDNRTRIGYMQLALDLSLKDLPLVLLYVRSQAYACKRGLDFIPRRTAR